MRIAIFTGSSNGQNAHRIAAASLGARLAEAEIGIVYGGAHVGLMGVLADSALDAGGDVLGVIPRQLVDWEVAHHGLTGLEIVDTMHERKALMADLSDGFVALPGGFGTFEEFCEVLTWSQLSLHATPKPCALLDVAGFYRPLVELFDTAADQGFIRPEHRGLVLVATDPPGVIEALAGWEAPPPTRKWVD